jgi:alkanesulfonate monooxygenase
MSLEVFWRLPLAGDGRSVAADEWQRGDFSSARRKPHAFARTGVQRDGYTYYDLLLQIGRAAEITGFDGVWIPESPGGEEPLIVAGSLARETPRLRLVPTFRPALLSAVYATKIAVSFQRLTGGRLAWNVTSTDEVEGRQWHGRQLPETEQIERAGEFLDVAKGFWSSPPFTYAGKYYEVVDGGFAPALQGEAFPRVYLSGTSDEALALSARHADVHLFPLGPASEVREQIARLSQFAEKQGRPAPAIGLEVELLARHDSVDAQAEARRRPSARAGLVGSFPEVVEALGEYARAGVSTFVLGAYPHLEEAYAIGEHVLPFIRQTPGAEARAAS